VRMRVVRMMRSRRSASTGAYAIACLQVNALHYGRMETWESRRLEVVEHTQSLDCK
jgi:hypothetical protein